MVIETPLVTSCYRNLYKLWRFRLAPLGLSQTFYRLWCDHWAQKTVVNLTWTFKERGSNVYMYLVSSKGIVNCNWLRTAGSRICTKRSASNSLSWRGCRWSLMKHQIIFVRQNWRLRSTRAKVRYDVQCQNWFLLTKNVVVLVKWIWKGAIEQRCVIIDSCPCLIAVTTQHAGSQEHWCFLEPLGSET